MSASVLTAQHESGEDVQDDTPERPTLTIADINNVFSPCNEQETRAVTERVFDLEKIMRTMPGLEIPVQHCFGDGVYARSITIPKDTLLTGKVHLTNHINAVLKGSITVMTDAGMQRITAPALFSSKAGTKRIGYAHEETIWVTFLGTNDTDVDVIEDKLITNSIDEYRRISGTVAETGE